MTFLIALICGAFGWTFTEYGMHHWNGHLSKGRLTFSREHLAHHREFGYSTPWPTKIRMSLPVLFLVFGGSWALAGLWNAVGFTVGLTGAYLGYEWVHHISHVAAPRTAFGRWARRHHFYHHFTSAKYNHGVTSPLWDVVFRTYRAPGMIRVPPKHIMPWLIDESGAVKPEFAAHYELIDKRRSPVSAAAA